MAMSRLVPLLEFNLCEANWSYRLLSPTRGFRGSSPDFLRPSERLGDTYLPFRQKGLRIHRAGTLHCGG
jgi:hypothetical protein